MRLGDKNISILKRLLNGETLPSSSAKTKLVDELITENILFISGKHKKTIRLPNEKDLHTYLSNQYQISDLNKYLNEINKENFDRAQSVNLTTNSKDSNERVFKGFLVNSLKEISARLNGKNITIIPPDGSFLFIYDFESFLIDENITIVGIENSLNFRHLKKQAYLFEDDNLLFISRYPQNQSKDFIRWIKSIPNKYLHFGDFDLAGIAIYLNEYKKHLANRAQFFVPKTIETDLPEFGNRNRYDIQKQNFDIKDVEEPALIKLVELFHKYKKGLDQEFYIIN